MVTPRAGWSGLVAAAVLTAAAPPARADEPIDLEHAIAEAVAASHALRAARSQEDAALARSGEAAASRWPVATAQLSYDYATKVNRIELPAPPGQAIEFGDGHVALGSVGVELPLYTGGTLSARAGAAEARARAAAYDVASDSLDVVHETRVVFYRALGAEAAARTAALAVQRLQRHGEELQSRLRLGAASREGVVEALARLRAAEQQELAARAERDVARLELGRLVGRPGEPLVPGGDLSASLLGGVAPAGPDMLDGLDAGGRPELAAAASLREGADLEARAYRGAYLPTVTAGARVLYGRPGVEIVQNDWMSWETAGVRLSWPLWDGTRKRRVERAKAESDALQERQDDLRRLLDHALGVARARVAAAREQAAKADERVALERERFDLVNGRYQKGMARESELLDAHDDLAEAEANTTSVRAALRLAEADLLHAVSR
jgi:outer membrane protein TolC